MTSVDDPSTKQPTLFQAILPVVFLIVLLTFNVLIMQDEAISGPNQIALLLSAAVAGIVSLRLGYKWKVIEKSMLKSIHSAMGAMIILLLIGALSGTWMISGIVPVMIYYGIKIINPTVFLLAACISSAIVAIATGSSWTTVATIGIALLGIGQALGFREEVIAGAILSGAYFGDKISPLSDTTNLASSMAGTDLFVHIKYIMYTTVPTILITLIIFGVWGIFHQSDTASTTANDILVVIEKHFNLSPFLLLVPAVVVFMIAKKIPALPTLLVGALLGGFFAVIFQPQAINQISEIDNDYSRSSFISVMRAMTSTVAIDTGNETLNALLKSKGMAGMLNTIWLILCAMIFGGVMESSGLLFCITQRIIKSAHSVGSLVSSTAATCLFFNVTASDQYMAISIPGRMFYDVYQKRKLKPEVLSRTLEDSGTVTSVLVPWNTCGATQAGVLGVATIAYAPYTFFCIISPFMSVLHAYLNINIRKIKENANDK